MREPGQISRMFDGIAPEYDRLNHLLSLEIDRTWRQRALDELVTPSEGTKVLDVACGTGDFSIAIARHLGQSCQVTGLDISEGMLNVMRTKVNDAGLSGIISIEKGDGAHIPYPDATFDNVTIAFGIRNFENRESGLKEMFRVLKPGGKIVILELSIPSNRILRNLYSVYFTKVIPFLGGKISGNATAYSYLPASVIAFPGKDEWMRTMEECGFSDVRHKSFTLGICRMYTGTRRI